MKIGITGATGQLGQLVVSQLKSVVAPASIVALVRNPAKAESLGVEARAFDYEVTDGLTSALEGIDTLLLISSNEIGQRERQHRAVISAAKEAGVKRIVCTSILRADASPINLASEHLATEKAILASGLAYTILRNGWYTENYLGSLGGVLAGGAFLGSAGDAKISLATRADFAAAAVAVLTTEDHTGKVYELAGDTGVTLSDLAAEISRQTGRDIPYRNLSEAEYGAILQQFGIPEGFAKMIAGWDVDAANGALFDDQKQLSQLIGRPTTPLSTAVTDALATL